jgi:hypothetical protein
LITHIKLNVFFCFGRRLNLDLLVKSQELRFQLQLIIKFKIVLWCIQLLNIFGNFENINQKLAVWSLRHAIVINKG